jgi:hypothetical protein
MKTFKNFAKQIDESVSVVPKAKGEADFVAAHEVEITDPTDQATDGAAKVVTKDGSGKRKADRLDNKQAMGEDLSSTIISAIRKNLDETSAASTVGGLKSGEGKIKQGSSDQTVPHSSQDPASTIGGRKGSEGKIKQGSSDEDTPDTGKGEAIDTIGGHKNREAAAMKQGSSNEKLPDQGGLGSREKEKNVPQGSSKEKTPDTGSSGAINTIGGHRNREATSMLQGSSKEKIPESVQVKTYRQMMREAYFNKQQTKMAHTIGKEFEKKGVGDESKGGPYAVATAMVRDKPDAAQKAYSTIKSKMKEEADAEILFNLYNDLNEENQEFFMAQLEEDAESLLTFAKNLISE